jgi:tRNA(adenine34) deaminase
MAFGSSKSTAWRSARAAESARLESVCGATHRGFESHLLRVTHEEAMDLALAEARRALDHGDVPVGAVVIINGELVASRHNERELTGDPTAHAEVLALRDAATKVGNWRLENATLVVTLEPCPMCAGALLNARVPHLVFGASDPKAGATGSLYNFCADARLNHETSVVQGVRAAEAAGLLTDFFASKR